MTNPKWLDDHWTARRDLFGRIVAVSVALATGCSRATSPVDGTISSTNVDELAVEAPRGDVRLYAVTDDDAPLDWWGELRARASRRTVAEARLADASLDATVDAGVATLSANLPDRVTIDLTVATPATLPARVAVPRGAVVVEGLAGGVDVEASRVELWDVAGPVLAEVGGGSGLMRVRPAAGAGVYVKTRQGDIWLQIPIGLPYHLIIEGPPDSVWQIGALGLTEAIELPGRFEGRAGDGSVPVRVETWGGVVTIEGF